MKKRKSGFYYFFHNRNGVIGLCGVLLIVAIGLIGPLLIAKPEGYTTEILLAPSAAHWLGTDSLGLDIFAQLVWGARTSLYVSILTLLVAAVIGLPLGLSSGYVHNWVSDVIDAIVDIFLTIPMLPLTIIMAAIMGANISNVALILGLFSWPSLARVTKNSTLKIREMQYIEAATCLGISRPRILFKHVLLNASGPVFVNLTLVMASAVLCDAVDRDGNMGAADAAALAGLGPEDDAREAQAVEPAEKTGPVGQQLQQGGGEHVPGGAHGAVQIQGIQGRTSRSSTTAR